MLDILPTISIRDTSFTQSVVLSLVNDYNVQEQSAKQPIYLFYFIW